MLFEQIALTDIEKLVNSQRDCNQGKSSFFCGTSKLHFTETGSSPLSDVRAIDLRPSHAACGDLDEGYIISSQAPAQLTLRSQEDTGASFIGIKAGNAGTVMITIDRYPRSNQTGVDAMARGYAGYRNARMQAFLIIGEPFPTARPLWKL